MTRTIRAGAPGAALRHGAGLLVAAAIAFGATAARADADVDPRRSVAVLEYRAGSTALPAVERRMAEILRGKTSLDVVDAEDARQRYGRNLDRQLASCGGDAGCIAGIGEALGVSEVMLVGVSEFGDVILTLQRIGVAQGKVVARVAEAMAPGVEPGEAELVRYVQRVLPRSDFLRFGILRINANVAGAEVVIGGRSRGRTPVEPLRVRAPATYEIQLTKEGFVPFRAAVAVPPDAEVRVESTLTRQSKDAWYRRWWVISAISAIAVGSVTTAVVIRTSSNDVPVIVKPF